MGPRPQIRIPTGETVVRRRRGSGSGVVAGRLLALCLLAGAVGVPVHAQEAADGETRGASDGTVRAVGYARVGSAFAFAFAVASAGGGVEVALSRRFGIRGDAGVLASLSGEGAVFTSTPAAVLYLGEGGADGAGLRAGPLLYLGETEDVTVPYAVGPFLGFGTPLGSGPIRFDALVALLRSEAVLLEAGIGAAFP